MRRILRGQLAIRRRVGRCRCHLRLVHFERRFLARNLHLDALDFRRRARRDFFDRRFLFLYRFFFRLRRAFLGAIRFVSEKLPFLLFVIRVISQIFRQDSVFHFQNAPDRLVQEIAIMRDDEASAAESADRFLDHFARRNIQMVRRLVQNEKIRPRQEHRQKREPRLFAARQKPDIFEDVLAAEEKHPERAPGLALSHAKLILNLLQHRKRGIEALLLLRVIRDADIVSQRDEPVVRPFLAQNHFEQRRLPRAIGTDEADRLAATNL